ncbi:MAG: LptE family protein [Desulfobulbaceae bacterium]|uniref:LptE family protein n=1 Tax=Candidatus Desulfatifera sulfidica TaxID=2841691 RepID=A0A8J6N8D3_9BACT|nr:LptE family protein [Candidatus Desulfatifera sulfidica]
MKTSGRILILILVILCLPVSCGYRNPYIYTGPEQTIQINPWKNRTSDLGLSSRMSRSLQRWFQKSSAIKAVSPGKAANLLLAGEIISLDIPSLTSAGTGATSEVKVILTVRYVLKDQSSNLLLLEIPSETWTESYFIGSSNTQTAGNEAEALSLIIDDISEKIYLNVLTLLNRR